MSDQPSEQAVAIPSAVALPQIARMIQDIETRATGTDSRLVQFEILESMLGAENEEALFSAQEATTVASKDFIEIPFRLQAEDIRWYASAPNYVEQGGFPFYALLTVTTIQHGDRVVVNAGGLSVIGILRKLLEWEETKPADEKPFAPYADEGGKPLQFVSRATNGGFNVVLLKPVITVQTNAKKPTRRGSAA